MPQMLMSLHDFPPALRFGAVSVGNFDGVHRGHAELIGRLVATARSKGGPAVVMTFDPPPASLLFPDRPLDPPLTTIRRRADLLFDLGVDALVAYPTNRNLLSLSAEEFFQRKIVRILHAKAVVEGPNFKFGRNREGDVDQLKSLCREAGIDFSIAQATEDGAGLISSTRIRKLLAAGEVRRANSLLTQPYLLEGVVVSGAGRGRELGFPTANLEQIESLIPGGGVYAGRVQVDGKALPAAINVGPNPTFGESRRKVEVHIMRYEGSTLYDRRLRTMFIERIRDVVKFESIHALRAQITRDLAECARWLSCLFLTFIV